MTSRDKVFAELAAGRLQWGAAFSDHMLVYNHDGLQWDQGTIKPFGSLPLHPGSSILHYGTGVFEGAKAYAGPKKSDSPRLFRPQEHLRRLKRGCIRLALPEPPDDLLAGLCALVTKDVEWIPSRDVGSLYLRIAVVGTGDKIGVKRSQGAMCFIVCCPVGGYFSGGDKNKGLRLWAEKEYFRAMKGGVGSVKAGSNYGPAMVPAERAAERGYDQVLWLSDGKDLFVTESGMMNFFVVLKSGEVWTPPTDDLILPGITRMSVLEMLREKTEKTIREEPFTIDWLCEKIEQGEVCEMIGTGTGAIASTVSTIGYNGKDYTVPDVQENSVVTWIRTSLSKIHGEKDHPWIVVVDSESGCFKGKIE